MPVTWHRNIHQNHVGWGQSGAQNQNQKVWRASLSAGYTPSRTRIWVLANMTKTIILLRFLLSRKSSKKNNVICLSNAWVSSIRSLIWHLLQVCLISARAYVSSICIVYKNSLRDWEYFATTARSKDSGSETSKNCRFIEPIIKDVWPNSAQLAQVHCLFPAKSSMATCKEHRDALGSGTIFEERKILECLVPF